ncbi:SET domain-containing protein, partial [Fistulina hepatica ATCC 64428]
SGAGYGLFARFSCAPSSTLFEIPATAIMCTKTLIPLYTSSMVSALSAVQLISMHIFLWRAHPSSRESPDAAFGPYISVLPRDFASHPLSWICNQEHEDLLSCLPVSVRHLLDRLHERFLSDWSRIANFLTRDGLCDHIGPRDKSHYLWAWLNVNTRCMYYQVKLRRTDPDNCALCPVMDFANHMPNVPHMLPRRMREFPTRSGLVFQSSAGTETRAGEELYLSYGAHSNRTLFVEYGFVNEVSQAALESGAVDGELDIQHFVEKLFVELGTLGNWMRSILEGEGYWGDWTLHSTPNPHPSFRVMAALRLFHLVSQVPSSSTEKQALQVWRDTLSGKRDAVSSANEQAWRETLVSVCEDVKQHTVDGMQRTNRLRHPPDIDWRPWMQANIHMLWQEEFFVADAVRTTTLAGADF